MAFGEAAICKRQCAVLVGKPFTGRLVCYLPPCLTAKLRPLACFCHPATVGHEAAQVLLHLLTETQEEKKSERQTAKLTEGLNACPIMRFSHQSSIHAVYTRVSLNVCRAAELPDDYFQAVAIFEVCTPFSLRVWNARTRHQRMFFFPPCNLCFGGGAGSAFCRQ